MLRNTKHVILAFILALCLLFSSCSYAYYFIQNALTATETETETETEETLSSAFSVVAAPDWSLVFPRQQNYGSRDYLPDGEIEMLRFADMEYSRPDTDKLYADFRQLTDAVENGATADEILPAFFDLYDSYCHFYSMHTLANIRYYADLSNTYYKTEYEFCELASANVEEKLESFYKVCANSSQKAALESSYFGEGFFDYYIDYSMYTNPEYLDLAKQETAVMEAYHKALENPQIEFEGKLQSVDTLLAEYENDYSTYLTILDLYYKTYNPILGEYYIELVSIHQKMAEVLGYSSYADLCYAQIYGRDYSYTSGSSYIEDIRREIVPLYNQLQDSGLLYVSQVEKAEESFVRSTIHEVAGKLGGVILEAYNFMLAYDLVDLAKDSNKMDASFTTYIVDYEAPYILINAQGTTDDIFTYAHEFGHFTDSYSTYQAFEDLETAETFSQGMEWLALCNLDGILDAQQIEQFRIQQLVNTVNVLVSQAAYADFESRVYQLSGTELTVASINDIFREINIEYGFYMPHVDSYCSMSWIDVPHFFEAPYYVISYCVSTDTAMQIYEHELAKKGSGIELYNTLLNREEGLGIQAVTEAAGMKNPFAEGRVHEIAALIRTQLNLDEN